ncbi:MAG TPA: hypothetical protein VKQ31_03710 [Steroidobacteraceae bacterium]|nr:hypothetical protein [Steroidobacteraceae bacterium]
MQPGHSAQIFGELFARGAQLALGLRSLEPTRRSADADGQSSSSA